MARTAPAILTTSVSKSLTSKYASQTITPAAVASGVVTLTSADIGGDSGALLLLGSKYRLVVDGVNYYDTLLHDTDADEHFFRIEETVGAPSTDVITAIYLITESEQDLNVTGTLTAEALKLKSVWATDEDLTVTDQTVIYATTTSTNQFDVTLPTITAANHNRILFIRADVASGDVDIVPATGQQVAAGGASTKLTVSADTYYILQANYYAATAPNWEVVSLSTT